MAEQELERIYNVPLRKEAMKAPKYVRAAKASRALREFLVKHMKSENVKIGRYLNQAILEKGRKNVPHHVLVKAVKNKDGLVKAELVGAPIEKELEKAPVKEVVKKEEVKALMDKVDSEAMKKEQQEEEKKKILEKPLAEKKKTGKEKKELTKEQEEEIRGKDRPKRKDKSEMIKK